MVAAANLRSLMDSVGWRELIDGTNAPITPFTSFLLPQQEKHSLIYHSQLPLPSTLPQDPFWVYAPLRSTVITQPPALNFLSPSIENLVILGHRFWILPDTLVDCLVEGTTEGFACALHTPC